MQVWESLNPLTRWYAGGNSLGDKGMESLSICGAAIRTQIAYSSLSLSQKLAHAHVPAACHDYQ